MQTKIQILAEQALKRFTEYNQDGLRVMRDGYTSNDKMTIGKVKKTIKQWVYFTHYGFFPSSRIRVLHTDKSIVDHRYLFAAEDLS